MSASWGLTGEATYTIITGRKKGAKLTRKEKISMEIKLPVTAGANSCFAVFSHE